MKWQKGYTLVEMFIAIILVAALGLAGSIVYIGWHFISKFW